MKGEFKLRDEGSEIVDVAQVGPMWSPVIIGAHVLIKISLMPNAQEFCLHLKFQQVTFFIYTSGK